jgi:predicted esterase YcpF (UPF0227 family)
VLPDYLFLCSDSHDFEPGDSSSSFGYFGKVYLNHVDREIIFVHRSTTLNKPQQHECSSFVALANISSDVAIYSQVLPTSTTIALNFVKKQLEALLREYSDYTCVHVGHSLGGFHAHVCGYLLKHRVIAIDPPGAKEVITQLDNELDTAQCAQHYNFFMMKNLINKTNNHVGKLAYHTYQDKESISSFEECTRTLETHSLDFFMAHIPKDAPDPMINLPDGFFWQETSVRNASTLFYSNPREKTGKSTPYQCVIQ